MVRPRHLVRPKPLAKADHPCSPAMAGQGILAKANKDFDRIIAFLEHGMVISTQVVILAPILFKCTWSAIMAAGVTPEILDA